MYFIFLKLIKHLHIIFYSGIYDIHLIAMINIHFKEKKTAIFSI